MRLSVCLLMFGIALLFAAPTNADRDIVFSAQFYRWSKHYHRDSDDSTRERTLDDVGQWHIYRINPDGTGLTRITNGRFDDSNPKWSPNGQEILFTRGRKGSDDPVHLMLVGPEGQNSKTFATFRGREIEYFRYEWSPSGHQIAIHYQDGGYSAPTNHMLRLDSRSGRKLKTLNADDFSWSPDGRSIYLSKSNGDSILDLAGGKTRKLGRTVIRPVWVRRHLVAGFKHKNEPDASMVDRTHLRLLDVNSSSTSDVPFIDQREDHSPLGYGPYNHSWYLLYSEALLALESEYGISDGAHYNTYIVNCNSGFWKHVIEGPTVAVSPDGRRLLVTTHQWVGPYKRGGRRCGPLEIVDAVTLKRRKITTNLVTIGGGDWRGKRRRTMSSYSFR